MARSAIPDFGIEYPDYQYRAWPKYVGMEADGTALIAESEEEFRRFQDLAVYPKTLGKDKHGNEIVAHTPRDEEWHKSRVVKQAIAAAEPVANALTGDEPRRGPGRPAKAA